jgi:hypothetical protein
LSKDAVVDSKVDPGEMQIWARDAVTDKRIAKFWLISQLRASSNALAIFRLAFPTPPYCNLRLAPCLPKNMIPMASESDRMQATVAASSFDIFPNV